MVRLLERRDAEAMEMGERSIAATSGGGKETRR